MSEEQATLFLMALVRIAEALERANANMERIIGSNKKGKVFLKIDGDVTTYEP